jgi:DNA-binding NarL/FixJ family response regulator
MPQPPSAPNATASMSGRSGPESRLRRLLLVSDEVASAEALRSHLARHGFLVGVANSARAAVNAAVETKPDVVLVDAAIHHGWPGVVTALDPHVSRQRVAVLAAYWSTEARRSAEAEGIGGILLKQLEGSTLALRLREISEGASERPIGPHAAGVSGGAR